MISPQSLFPDRALKAFSTVLTCASLIACGNSGIELINASDLNRPAGVSESLPPGADSTTASTTQKRATGPKECALPDEAWVFCDDFESDRLKQYFEYDNGNKSFVRSARVGMDGSWGMKTTFQKGQVGAGSLKLAFGKTPHNYIKPVPGTRGNYREIYWRLYLMNEKGWQGGGGDKLVRAQSLANESWAQAMMAPIWSGSGADRDYLITDPASGVSGLKSLLVTKYNDIPNQRWLGSVRTKSPIFSSDSVGKWYCIEGYAKLNDPDSTNGEFKVWINDRLEASQSGLNWLSNYDDYGINAIFVENYWNDGSPAKQSRFIDRFIVSTKKIGC